MQSSNLKIDLSAIHSNIRYFSKENAVMAMVKANAYGTDSKALAPYLETFGVALLGVSHVQEAIDLREAGCKMPLFVISAPPFEAHLVAKYDLQPAVSSIAEIEALARAAKKPIGVHLHIDTGMNRFGVAHSQALKLAEIIESNPSLSLEGVMTHFASAELPKMDPFTHKQIVLFREIVGQLKQPPRWIHIANGPGALRFSLPFCNLVRIGLSLFGYGSPHLRPALAFETRLSFISTPQKGETVGYSCAHRIEKDQMRLGVIPVGYYDGIHRHYKEQGYVKVRGKSAPMVGNICMDFMMIDLTDIPEAQVGDTVTLFDASLSPELVAKWGNTDVRELLASIGPRTKRIFHYEQRIPSAICPLEENSPSTKHLTPA